MRRFFLLILSFVVIFISCPKPTKKIDITTQLTIQGEPIPLRVTHISPVGSVEGMRETFKILVGFNQAMTPLQAIPRDQTEGPIEFDPPIKGKYRWMGSRTFAFIPSDTLQPATAFKATLRMDKIQSLTSMRLDRDTSWEFESVRPVLYTSIPYHSASFNDVKACIYLNFNIEMAPERVGDKIKIFAEHGRPSYVYCGTPEPAYAQYREEIGFKVRQLEDREKKEYPLKDWDNRKTLVLVPRGQLPIESEIQVEIAEGLLARNGNLGTSMVFQLSFNTYNVFCLTAHSDEAYGGYPLELCFSNPVAISEIVKNIVFDPALDSIPDYYREEVYEYTSANLYLPFKVNTNYKIKIKRDLKDKFGNRLDKDYDFIFKVGDYLPYAYIPSGINLVEQNSDLRFPATFMNVDNVDLDMGVVNLEGVISFLKQPRVFNSCERFESPGFFLVSRTWNANTYEKYPNTRVRLPIKLSEVLGDKKSGLVYIQFDDGINTCPYQKAFLEINDLGITWKYAPENNIVWVTSLFDTKPIDNARVQFRDKNNRILWQGNTDQKGFCEFPGWSELRMAGQKETYDYESEYESEYYTSYYEPEFWLTVSRGDQEAVYSNEWGFGIDPWRFNINYNWYARAEEYGGYVFTEKGLYRSGETVHVKGILRKKKRGLWVLPDVSSIKLVVTDSRSEEVLNEMVGLNQYGTFAQDIVLEEESPTGVYSMSIVIPDKDYSFYESFRVEAYRPAEFEVKAYADKDTFIAGENFKGRIVGRYLFGMPMRSADASWCLYRDYHYVSYPQHKDYSFSGFGDYDYESNQEVLGSGKGKLNDKGEFAVTQKLSPAMIKRPSAITLEGTVTAPNKRSLSGRQNWIVYPANLLVGLKTSKYLYTLGDKMEISMIVIRPSGEKLEGKKVDLKVTKREWKSIKKARLGGRYEWISELSEKEVKKQKATSRLDSTVIAFAPDEPGYYYVDAVAKDEKGREASTRIYFYVAGSGYAGWEMRDDDIIELVPDKDLYQVGDTARILVKSPYDSANALITVERELVLRKFSKTLHGNADYIEIPIKSIDLPNIYVCVMLLRGRVKELAWDEEKEQDLGRPQFKIGYANLKVDTKEKHLVVKTNSDRSEYKPRDSVTVFYEVKDFKNAPVKNCEVSLFVVDVGVLNLIDFQTPNPFDYFYGPRSLSVKTIESRVNILGERSYGEKGEERGGGGLEEAPAPGQGISYREKFLSTVYFKANLKTDAAGKGKVRFALPDNLTKFRIMLVAQTQNSEFGSADSIFAVNLPFIVTGSVPRLARVGDKFKAGVVLHNRTKSENKANVECNIEGLKMLDNGRKEVILPPDGSKEVLFEMEAEQAGKAVFKFAAKMGSEQDALKMTIPVKNPPFIEAVALFNSTPDSALEGIFAPENIYENIGGLEVLLSSSVLAGMKTGIDYLLDYPYLCLEQRLSRILPFIVGEDIINQFKLAPLLGKELRDSVQKVLDEVPDYQLYNGGFVYWVGGIYPCPYLSAYTMHVLYRARQSGYAVDDDVVRRGNDFLSAVLRWDDVDWTYPYNEYAKLQSRAFCVYSLSLWGNDEPGYASKLYERREQIPLFGKALLLKAGRELGMGSAFENELARIITNKIKLTPTTAHFEESELRGWTFPSPAKVTGYVIQTFIELDLDFPYKDQVVRWLVQERGKKSKPTTHENAFVFDAFQTYYKKYEKEEPDFVARIILGEKEILKQEFKGRTNEPPTRFYYTFDKIKKNELLPIKVSKDGTGRLYYTMRMFYAFKENPIAFDEGFYVWKEILTLDGREVKKFRRGDVYKVVLHIVVPETRIFAVVDDPLPAGFEPVQTFFATESRQIQEEYWEDQWEEAGHWWGSFDHEEQYDDKMLFFAQELFPGEHTQVYYIRAGTSGKFIAPAAKAEEMYSPEVFGSTTQGFVTIE